MIYVIQLRQLLWKRDSKISNTMKTVEMKVTVRRFIFLDFWINPTSEQTYLDQVFSSQRTTHSKTSSTNLLKYAVHTQHLVFFLVFLFWDIFHFSVTTNDLQFSPYTEDTRPKSTSTPEETICARTTVVI